MKIAELTKFLFKGLNQLLWPGLCQGCGQLIAEEEIPLCGRCWQSLFKSTGGVYCPGCGRDCSAYTILDGTCPACQNEEFQFDAIARAGRYQELMRVLILKFKNGQTSLKSYLSPLLAAALQGSDFAGDFDYIVPVPLHWKRRLKRGYNQTLLLAGSIADRPIETSSLVRIRNTTAQFTLSAAKRRKNVAGAFAIRKDHDFAGKKVCLVDDIKTTGATLNECARVLKLAGTEKVYALVLATAGQNGDNI